MLSTSSPNIEMRYAVSASAGCTSRVSPFTRKRPRSSTVSLRWYWVSTRRRKIFSRECSSPTVSTSTRSRYTSAEPRP